MALKQKRNKDIIVESKELKALIIQRLKDLNLELSTVCYREGLKYRRIRNDYLNKEAVSIDKLQKIYQKDIIRLCEAIGLEIVITVIKKKHVDIDKYQGLKLTEENIERWRTEFIDSEG